MLACCQHTRLSSHLQPSNFEQTDAFFSVQLLIHPNLITLIQHTSTTTGCSLLRSANAAILSLHTNSPASNTTTWRTTSTGGSFPARLLGHTTLQASTPHHSSTPAFAVQLLYHAAATLRRAHGSCVAKLAWCALCSGPSALSNCHKERHQLQYPCAGATAPALSPAGLLLPVDRECCPECVLVSLAHLRAIRVAGGSCPELAHAATAQALAC